MAERRRVVITGMGTVNPLGHSMAETWPRLTAGVSGVSRISRFDPAALGLGTHIAGEVRGFDPADHMDARAARRPRTSRAARSPPGPDRTHPVGGQVEGGAGAEVVR